MEKIFTVDEHYKYEDIKQLYEMGIRNFRINPARVGIECGFALYEMIRKDFDDTYIYVDTAGHKNRVLGVHKKELEKGSVAIGFPGDPLADILLPADFMKSIKVGDVLVIRRGSKKVNFIVRSQENNQFITELTSKATISSQSHVYIKERYLENKELKELDSLILKKFHNVRFGLSFADNVEIVKEARSYTKEKIYAKIESPIGVKNVSRIIDEADGIIIARDDLSCFYGYDEINEIMFDIIEKCIKKKKEYIPASNFFTDFLIAGFLSENSEKLLIELERKKVEYIYCNESVVKADFSIIKKIYNS